MHYADKVTALILQAYPDTQLVYCFGSVAQGRQTADSDLDVAVLLPPETAKKSVSWEWLTLQSHIAEAAGFEQVDLVNLHSANTVLQMEVLETGAVWFCADDDFKLRFEIKVIGLYQDLQIERREIIQQALKRGSFRCA